MEKRRLVVVHLALLFVQITFGSWAVFGKMALADLHPLQVVGLRAAGAVPIFLVLARVAGHWPSRSEFLRLALLGFTGVFANQLLYIFGLRLTMATNASILQTAVPVFTFAIAATLGVEKIGAGKVLGVALAVGGALVMLDPTRLFDAGAHVGDLFIIGNCLSYAVYIVLQRPLLQRMPALAVTAWAYVLGGVPILIVAAPTLATASWGGVPDRTWAAMIYIVLVPTTLNYLLISFAIKHSSAALTATYTTLQPLAATLLAALVLGESAGWRQVAGFLLIVLGLAAVTVAQLRSGAAAPPAR